MADEPRSVDEELKKLRDAKPRLGCLGREVVGCGPLLLLAVVVAAIAYWVVHRSPR
jgi:hypothetical protein